MPTLTAPGPSHLLRAIGGLVASRWKLVDAPAGARLRRNQQLVVLKVPGGERRIRLSVYKVTGSGRQRADERRIEITTTYASGLPLLANFEDVVLGYDFSSDVLVGVDPRRLQHGGPTSNASTFFDAAGLGRVNDKKILVVPYPSQLFGGVEYHAFLKPLRLSEYVFNLTEIHAGVYEHRGEFSGPIRARPISFSVDRALSDSLVASYPRTPSRRTFVTPALVAAAERGDHKRLRRANLTPDEYAAIRSRCEENGHLGEVFVLDAERKRLKSEGRSDLASQVRWISQESVAAGYDISSFEADGTRRYIEVKATSGNGMTFEMSQNEWTVAQSHTSQYFIYRVTSVRTKPVISKVLNNPVQLEADGTIRKTASGWLVFT